MAHASPGHIVPDYIMTLVNSTLGAIIGIVVVNLVYQWYAEKDLEDDMTQTIVEALAARESGRSVPRLYELYNKRSIERILKQCLESYCTNAALAQGYLNYIKNSYRVIKKEEVYKVCVLFDTAMNKMCIKQELTDTRIFDAAKVQDKEGRENELEGEVKYDKNAVLIKSYLIFKKGENVVDNGGTLNVFMKSTSYFFREELPDAECVNHIVALFNAGRKEEILEFLNYKVSVFRRTEKGTWGKSFPITDFTIVLDRTKIDNQTKYKGLIIYAQIPREYVVTNDTGYFEDEKFVQYRAKMEIKYSIPSDYNTFCAVYPVPVCDATFKLIFRLNNFDCDRDLDYMTFHSYVNQDNQGNYDESAEGTIYSFTTKDMIFPRSGMSFYWNKDKNVVAASAKNQDADSEPEMGNVG